MTSQPELFRIDGGGFALEACWQHVEAAVGAAVVAAPHPLYGGTRSNPVVVAACQSLQRLRLSTLSFNYRGTGTSEGEATGSLEAGVDDYAAAYAVLRERSPGPFVLAGYSFGAGAALLSACQSQDTHVQGLLLLAPPLGLLRAEDLVRFTGKLLVIVGDDDEYAPAAALESLLGARPNTELEILKGTDHFFHYGALAQLCECIERRASSLL